MDALKKIEEAAWLLREAALEFEKTDILKLDYEIKIKPMTPFAEDNQKYFCVTSPGEKLPPSK